MRADYLTVTPDDDGWYVRLFHDCWPNRDECVFQEWSDDEDWHETVEGILDWEGYDPTGPLVERDGYWVCGIEQKPRQTISKGEG